jgi:hypothetical protein
MLLEPMKLLMNDSGFFNWEEVFGKLFNISFLIVLRASLFVMAGRTMRSSPLSYHMCDILLLEPLD